MSDRRRGLGRGLGALIPNTPSSQARPVDVFFPGGPAPAPPSEPLGEVPPALAGDLVDVPGARFAEIPGASRNAGSSSPLSSDRGPGS